MAKIAKGDFAHASLEETQFLIKKSCANVWEEKKREVEIPGHKTLKAAVESHPAMLRQNHMARCLPCHNGTAKNPQTRCRYTGTGPPQPNRHRQLTPEPMPPRSGTPHAPTGNTSSAQHSPIVHLAARYAHSHISLPRAELFTLDPSTQDSQHDTEFDPDILTDEGTSTG
jgi:hypothetical protein